MMTLSHNDAMMILFYPCDVDVLYKMMMIKCWLTPTNKRHKFTSDRTHSNNLDKGRLIRSVLGQVKTEQTQ